MSLCKKNQESDLQSRYQCLYIYNKIKALPDVLALASLEARLNIISQTLTLQNKSIYAHIKEIRFCLVD